MSGPRRSPTVLRPGLVLGAWAGMPQGALVKPGEGVGRQVCTCTVVVGLADLGLISSVTSPYLYNLGPVTSWFSHLQNGHCGSSPPGLF